MSTIFEHSVQKRRPLAGLLFAILAVLGLMAGLIQVPSAHAQEEVAVNTDEAVTVDTDKAVEIPESVEAVEIASAEGREKGALFITEATLRRTSNKPSNAPLLVGEGLEFKFKWDASKYYGTPDAAQAGDTLTVTLPSWAQFAPGTAEMKKDGVSVGTCVQSGRVGTDNNVIENSKVVCTLNENVNNRSDVSGGFESTMWLFKAETINPTSFPVGPVDVIVDLNSIVDKETLEKGITPGKSSPIKPEVIKDNAQQAKVGHFHGLLPSSEGKAIIEWLVLVKGNGDTVTVRDALSAPQEKAAYVDNKYGRKAAVQVRVRDPKAEGETGGNWNLVGDGNPGTSIKLDESKFNVDWTQETVDGENKNVVTVAIPKTEVGKWYRVSVFAQVDPDYYRAGDKISNTATINGEERSYIVSARNTINAYGEGKLGLGDVYIFKNVHGADPAAIPADYSANIKADITYPDHRKETKTLTVKPGNDPATAAKLTGLPYLTKVTLTEEKAGAVPGFKLESSTLGEGKAGTNVPQDDFIITPDKSSVTLTVRNAGVTEVGVNNTYVADIKYGDFNITKSVTPANLQAVYGKEYEITYTCDNDSKDGSYKANTPATKLLRDGQKLTIGQFPVGTSCVVDESDANVPGFSWVKSQPQTIVITEGTGANVNVATVTNTYNEQLGNLRVRKVANIEPAAAVADKEFIFNIRCERVNPAFAQDFVLKVKAGEEGMLNGIPAGSTCVVTEDSKSAEVPGYTWALAEEKISVEIPDGADAEAVVENNYTKNVGKLVVTKTITAPVTAGVSNKTFDFTYRCEQKQLGEVTAGEITGVTTGTTKTVENIPAGSECVVTEKDAHHPLTTWTVEGGTTQTVTVDKDRDGLVQFTNAYTELTGKVQVNKELAGSAAELESLKTQVFEATYTCVKNGAEVKGSVKFSVNEPAVITNIPLGAVCSFTESTAGLDQLAGLQFDTSKSTVVVNDVALPTAEADKDKVTEVKLINHFDELGRINLKKVVKGFRARFATGQQFPITASWKLEGQDAVSVDFILKDGEVYDQLPQLPVGTVVTFTETLPADGVGTDWQDPKYSGEGVKDLDNAKAEVTVQSGTHQAAVEVELANKVNPPLWWIPLLAIPFLPQPPAPNYNTPAGAVSTTPAPETSPASAKGIAKQQQQDNNKGALANTGASVLWVLLIGLVAAAIGAILYFRARRES